MLLYVYIISYNIVYIILWVYIVYKRDFMMQIDNFLPFWKRDKYRIKTPVYAWIINGSKLQVIGIKWYQKLIYQKRSFLAVLAFFANQFFFTYSDEINDAPSPIVTPTLPPGIKIWTHFNLPHLKMLPHNLSISGRSVLNHDLKNLNIRYPRTL